MKICSLKWKEDAKMLNSKNFKKVFLMQKMIYFWHLRNFLILTRKNSINTISIFGLKLKEISFWFMQFLLFIMLVFLFTC
jgi:uncharacterized membrane protein